MEFTVSDPLTGTADVNDRGSIIVAMPHIMPCPFDYTIGFDPCRSVMIAVYLVVLVPLAGSATNYDRWSVAIAMYFTILDPHAGINGIQPRGFATTTIRNAVTIPNTGTIRLDIRW